MNAFWQNLMALAIVAASATWVARRIYRLFFPGTKGGCGGCGHCSCESGEAASSSVVSLDVLAGPTAPKQ